MNSLVFGSQIFVVIVLLLCFTSDISCAVQDLEQPMRDGTMEVKRQFMLSLINKARKAVNKNLTMLYIDDQLNPVAQNHSVDMVNRDFFDHINPDGKDPVARAKMFKFKYLVGENIAKGKNLTRAHQLIMQSQKHYNNTIDPQWTRCGIGFSYNKKNSVYVTILFSVRDLQKFPVGANELEAVRKQISIYIKKVNPQLVSQNRILSTFIKGWLDFSSSNTISVIEYMKQIHYFKLGIIYLHSGTKLTWSDNLIKKITNANMFVQKNMTVTNFGVNLKMRQMNVEIMAVYISK